MLRTHSLGRFVSISLLAGGWVLLEDPARAATPKRSEGKLDQLAFFRPELAMASSHVPLDELLDRLPNQVAWREFLAADAVRPPSQRAQVFIDPRSGAASNILAPFPLIPGRGVGNRVTLAQLAAAEGRALAAVDSQAVAGAVRRFIEAHKDVLGIDARQLGPARAEQVHAELWHVSFPQVVRGVPVRDARIAATINNGNLVTIGAENWGNVRLDVAPRTAAAEAVELGFRHADGRAPEDVIRRAPRLEIVPAAAGATREGEAFQGPVGRGYAHRLVWTFVFQRPPEDARWELMVDAHDGEVLAFQDINRYVERSIVGGVYPLTSTGICPNAQTCGTMQTNWPMPFADTGFPAPNNFTNSGGIYNYTSGTATTTLTGPYVDINDNCGAISNSSGTGDINLGGSNNQHDCTSGGGSAGNTPASRTAFYEVNKLAELARGWLPSNAWLQSQLDVNVNINNTCNAFWNGVTINFYRSGGGCRNTGELAGVFDHEWGHGLDDFDSNGSLSNSSEAYADIAAIYRLNASCVGHGFFETVNDGCGMTADGTGFNADENQVTGQPQHCDLDCSGVRDSDYLKHNPNTPDTALGFVCSQCLSGPGPCGRQVHCAAAPVRQAAWDLVKRDLTAAPFSFDTQTALLAGNRLFYLGSGNVGAWHSCTCGGTSSGCGATNGYMQWLAADDNNGNVNDGTPHMTAIHAAYNRHGIACSTPTPVNSGCSGQPNGGAGPTLSATPGNFSAALSWTPVTGASRYWVMRTEGHAGAEFGKARIADITGTSFTDTQVANGRSYWYNVVAQGSSTSCYSRVSNAVQVTPAGSPNPDFSISCNPSSLTIPQGANGTSTCTVTSTNAFNSAVTLDCTGLPAGASCSYSPNPVTPPPNGNVNSTMTVTVSPTTPTGTTNFQARGTSGSLVRTFGMSLTVTPGGGGGAQMAAFDGALQAPKCGTVGTSCDTGPTLIRSRDTLATPETNQPNTINDSCADGTSGAYLTDESIEALKLVSVDGTNFAAGKQVRLEATVHVWAGGPGSDHLDLYYAPDANSPVWTAIATNITPTQGGIQTFTATYTLPASGPANLQAVRANFRYQGAVSSCSPGAYDDHDDLAFAVTPAGPVNTVFFDNFETNLGWITNPNGTDTATTGQWERGDPQDTNSSGPKQLGTTVSGVNDLVTGRLAGANPGDFDIDGGVTSIQSPPITLPATGTLTLSFSHYMAHGTNSSSADFLRVRIVGSPNTLVFEELGAANDDDAAWVVATANLNAFAGQTIRILIEAADASGASLVEAAVDDVRVTQQ